MANILFHDHLNEPHTWQYVISNEAFFLIIITHIVTFFLFPKVALEYVTHSLLDIFNCSG